MIDPKLFTVDGLILALVGNRHGCPDWIADVEIIPSFMPRYPQASTRPRCVVQYGTGEHAWFLRQSHGPRQEHFWDIYGDDYRTPEAALIALSQAQPPPPCFKWPGTAAKKKEE